MSIGERRCLNALARAYRHGAIICENVVRVHAVSLEKFNQPIALIVSRRKGHECVRR